VRRHGGEVLSGFAESVEPDDGGAFRVALTGGNLVVARRVLLAAGHPTETDERGTTLVRGLYASVADGHRVGAVIGSDLAGEDARDSARPSAGEVDWDRRYSGDRVWSGNPNGALVREVSGLDPGRALDVGAGEGADALWLAEHGWRVTASDISGRALARVASEADRRGLVVDCLLADANAPEPFEPGAFDLVTAQYASIPRTPDERAVHTLLRAVAPGGTVLVVSHDPEPMRVPIDPHTHSRAFDPDAYVRIDDVVAVLRSRRDWEIDVHERRARPPGAASSHHVDDIVLRACRAS
jgi:SAM-dependent methyltransferase